MATKPIFEDAPSWPAPTQFAPSGHNRPPLEDLIPAEFREALLADKPDFLVKLEQAVDAADRAVAEDDATLGRCGNLVNLYRAITSHIDATHVAVKAPYLLGGRLVDGEKNALVARVKDARAKVEGVANAYEAKRAAAAKAERDRIAADQRAAAERAAQAERDHIAAERAAADAIANAANEDERQAALERAFIAADAAQEAMAAAALAPAATAKAEPVRSDEGAVVSSTTEWACEVDDYAKAFKFVKNDAKVREAIDAAVKRLVKQTKGQLDMAPAVRVWPVSKASFR